MARSGDVSRRRFLGAGVGAASTVLLRSRSGRAAETGDDVRCGVIGVGGRGSGVLNAIHKSPGVRVAAICDIHAGRLNRAADAVAADKPRLFGDYRELIDFKELDAIFVETPCYLHAKMAVAVMESGRHCYSEKPLALSVADINRMVETENRTPGIFQVGTQLRYASPWQPAIKAIIDGVVGPPILIRAHRHNVGDYPRSRPWFFKRALSGDTICEQAVHEFDMFCWIFGRAPQRAAGFGGAAVHKEPPDRDIRDYYTMCYDFGKDMQVAYNHSWISSPKTYCDGRQEVVYGPQGTVDIENGMIFPKSGAEPYKVSQQPKGNSTQLAVDDFFRCIREGDQPLADIHAGKNGALTALLGLKALDTGQVVSMKNLLAEG